MKLPSAIALALGLALSSGVVGCTSAPQQRGLGAWLNGTCDDMRDNYLALAKSGNALTMFNMGDLAERGCGVSQDRDEAVAWYTESARRGNRRAARRLEALGAPVPVVDTPSYEPSISSPQMSLGQRLLDLLVVAAIVTPQSQYRPSPPPTFVQQPQFHPSQVRPASTTEAPPRKMSTPVRCTSRKIGRDTVTTECR